ncbi:MAG: chromate efflux transporter [Anaerolineae bacterium]
MDKSLKKRLLEVTMLFLKLGTISFGGPAAHIALMEQEAVHKRKWLSPEHFLDLLAAVNLIPGPNATEMAIHIGFVHAGWPGLIASGGAFIIPAFLISLAIAMLYVRLGTLPQVASLFYGINPLVLAIILVSVYRLGRVAIRDRLSLALGVACVIVTLAGVNEAVVLLTAGVLSLLLSMKPQWQWLAHGMAGGGLLPMTSRFAIGQIDNRLVRLGLFFLKVGSLLFGSGMVLFAFIQRDVVIRYAWLTQQQLLDAIAVGQITPGPVSSAATFIGYLVAGVPGAIVATLGMFLPSFVIVSLTGPWIPQLRESPLAQAFLKGVNAAVVALILSVGLTLLRAAIVDIWTVLALLVGVAILLRFRVDTTWLVLGGMMLGLVRYLVVER